MSYIENVVTSSGTIPTLDQILNPVADASFQFPATDGITFDGTAPASSSSNGTAAGVLFEVVTPTGGATTGSATTAGSAGDIDLTTGAGGSGSGGTNANGGRGGNVVVALGAGGAKSGSGTAGVPGALEITGGPLVVGDPADALTIGTAQALWQEGAMYVGNPGTGQADIFLSPNGDGSNGFIYLRGRSSSLGGGLQIQQKTSGQTANLTILNGGISATADISTTARIHSTLSNWGGNNNLGSNSPASLAFIGATSGNSVQFTLGTAGGSYTCPTISLNGNNAGLELTFIIVQNGTTAATFAWASNMHGGGTISATLGSVNVQKFVLSHNQSDWYAVTPLQSMTGGTP